MPLPMHINGRSEPGQSEEARKRLMEPSGYAPTPEYFPTYKPVRCGLCKKVGMLNFQGGFDLKAGDRVMEGKPIWGDCGMCGRRAELIPLPTDESIRKDIKVYYDIAEALKGAMRRGWRIGGGALLIPEAKQRQLEEVRARIAAKIEQGVQG